MRWSNRPSFISFAVGMTMGFSLCYWIVHSLFRSTGSNGQTWFAHNEKEQSRPFNDSSIHDNYALIGENEVARELRETVKVLCWVMTGPQNHESKARHVRNTWGKRCNVLLFMSSKEDKELPAVGLPVGEGRNNLWGKTREAFRYVWEKYKDEVDWFMKADDDTYVVVENLRYMLSAYNTSEPIVFGCKFKPFVKQGFFSGGAGYVLSKEATKRFVEQGLTNPSICRADHDGGEDVEIAQCLANLGVKAGDSRDSYGRGRFFPFVPAAHLIPGGVEKDSWFWEYIYYPMKEGLECCSDTAVSFHYVSSNDMYVLDYLIYRLKPFGVSNSLRGTPAPPPDADDKATPRTGS